MYGIVIRHEVCGFSCNLFSYLLFYELHIAHIIVIILLCGYMLWSSNEFSQERLALPMYGGHNRVSDSEWQLKTIVLYWLFCFISLPFMDCCRRYWSFWSFLEKKVTVAWSGQWVVMVLDCSVCLVKNVVVTWHSVAESMERKMTLGTLGHLHFFPRC